MPSSKPAFGYRLRAQLGPITRVRQLDSSPRSLVCRAEIGGTPVVIKQIVGGPDPDERFQREITALRLAARADPPLVPAIFGADPGERVLVLEHLDGGTPPYDWVVDYATALARLHAATGEADIGALPQWSPPSPDDTWAFFKFACELDVEVPLSVHPELDDLLHRLSQVKGHSLLHGDPCPGNDLYTGDGIRFIDLEQAALGDGLIELAYLRVGFPTCWCVTATPAPLLRRAEDAYHAAWRAATGTEPQGDLTDACLGWLMQGDALVERAHRDGTDHLARVTRRDWYWGTASARQRLLHRLAVAQEVTADRADLANIHLLVTGMRNQMLDRWPALPPLPARRPRDST
ncbi:aminoglycoside phosphotransferase family protein [Actinomadura rubrisoli]|uniref:Aminoglycoside phosphotransferase family protein n=1 Tax=Actinomadura rubrisoli TaxID=2530368 RepID=A0A4R5A186_9ACTN|nr:aminoglycoside phosphotransferase family protein [Actinomadura rubrisoli]TDD65588.1 aminoglycoside phosphotransferase family protein [Actinomadura rubrisoli]